MSRFPCDTVFCLILALVVLPPDASADAPPNGTLRVAYRQSEAGKLSESVHHVTLLCSDGDCSLTTLSLNQCGGGAFYPKMERSSTGERGFLVREVRPGLLLVEQDLVGTKLTYEFRHTTRDGADLSRRLGLKQTRWFDELRGFSGAAVKYSPPLEKVISWDLIPLRGRDPRIKAACDILLDGVPE